MKRMFLVPPCSRENHPQRTRGASMYREEFGSRTASLLVVKDVVDSRGAIRWPLLGTNNAKARNRSWIGEVASSCHTTRLPPRDGSTRSCHLPRAEVIQIPFVALTCILHSALVCNHGTRHILLHSRDECVGDGRLDSASKGIVCTRWRTRKKRRRITLGLVARSHAPRITFRRLHGIFPVRLRLRIVQDMAGALARRFPPRRIRFVFGAWCMDRGVRLGWIHDFDLPPCLVYARVEPSRTRPSPFPLPFFSFPFLRWQWGREGGGLVRLPGSMGSLHPDRTRTRLGRDRTGGWSQGEPIERTQRASRTRSRSETKDQA